MNDTLQDTQFPMMQFNYLFSFHILKHTTGLFLIIKTLSMTSFLCIVPCELKQLNFNKHVNIVETFLKLIKRPPYLLLKNSL